MVNENHDNNWSIYNIMHNLIVDIIQFKLVDDKNLQIIKTFN